MIAQNKQNFCLTAVKDLSERMILRVDLIMVFGITFTV